MGYRRLADYVGGMAEWAEQRGALERLQPTAPPRSHAAKSAWNPFEVLAEASVGRLASIWLGMVVVFAFVYWGVSDVTSHGLLRSGTPVRDFWTALYFSAVTATSLGYGDVVPGGIVRLLAVLEAVAELFIFGGLVSRFVSRRQDELLREMHFTSFEDHISRIRVNLLLILRELQVIGDDCQQRGELDERGVRRAQSRTLSTAVVFLGELRTIHGHLYRPTQAPEASALESMLTTLTSCLRELTDLCGCLPDACLAFAELRAVLTRIAELADEICGECVPWSYSESLKARMDEIRELGRKLRIVG